MKWMRHSRLEGQHAFLSASKHSWINYSDDKLIDSYYNFLATQRGTELHELAAKLIKQRVELPDKQLTFNMYVNDAIYYDLHPEQPLYFSDNCFGTADAIGFDEHKGFLRIHDLKTGLNTASMEQLKIYAALFFLEYDMPLNDIGVELRIYQNDDIRISEPEIDEIAPIMDRIIMFDKLIEEIKEKEHET